MVKLGRQAFKKWQLPLTLVLFLSGLLLVLALRSLAGSGVLPSRTQNENLANLIKSQESQIADIELDVSGRRNLLNTFQLNSAAGRQTLTNLQNQIKQQEALDGFTEVQGPDWLSLWTTTARTPRPPRPSIPDSTIRTTT